MDEDEYLQLSGIQHFAFCRRQWALIHVEEQWAENVKTVEGGIVHERAHDPDMDESRGDTCGLKRLVHRALNVLCASSLTRGMRVETCRLRAVRS